MASYKTFLWKCSALKLIVWYKTNIVYRKRFRFFIAGHSSLKHKEKHDKNSVTESALPNLEQFKKSGKSIRQLFLGSITSFSTYSFRTTALKFNVSP